MTPSAALDCASHGVPAWPPYPVVNTARQAPPACLMSVDVEEWFHLLEVPGVPPAELWAGQESRVRKFTHLLLEMFTAHRVRATLFFLGWVAERHPGLVAEAARAGHEIASHGYGHTMVGSLGRSGFEADLRRAKAAIEDAAGTAVFGYRAPGFSITPATPWAFEALAATGHCYDSSVWPGWRAHGGWPGGPSQAQQLLTPAGPLWVLPITQDRLAGRPFYCFGGGYLRLFPESLILARARAMQAAGQAVLFYVHPRDFDAGHPRLPGMGLRRRLMTEVNRASTAAKLRHLLGALPMMACGDWLHQLDIRAACGTAKDANDGKTCSVRETLQNPSQGMADVSPAQHTQ